MGPFLLSTNTALHSHRFAALVIRYVRNTPSFDLDVGPAFAGRVEGMKRVAFMENIGCLRRVGESELFGRTSRRLSSWLGISVSLIAICFAFDDKAICQLTILHSFGDGTTPNDGSRPDAGLIQGSDGNFYGATIGQAKDPDASANGGNIFQLTSGGVVTTLYASAPGHHVLSNKPLLFYNGDLFGVTSGDLEGTIYRLRFSTRPVHKAILHNFGDGAVANDGLYPQASMILGSDGYLYGTTVFGGTANEGTIYKLSPTTNQFTIIYNFTGTGQDIYPRAALIQASDGNFYGTTSGNASGGAMFLMTPAGQVFPVYRFTDGSAVVAPLIQAKDGNFYGITPNGGAAASGDVFKMTPNFVVTILHSFGQGTDGATPGATTVVQGPNGNLYGTTQFGGTAGNGVVFELTTDGLSYTVLHNFGDGSIVNDGSVPTSTLILGSDNNLYGTTDQGGSKKLGTIFRISP